jgi:hypothetical protein
MSDLWLYVLCPRGPESAELAMKLRGGPVFDVVERQRRYGVRLRRSVVDSADGSTTTPIPTTKRGDQVALVDLTHVVDLVDEVWTELAGNALTVVDVHFPLGSALNIQAIQPGRNDKTRSLAQDAEAAAHWDDEGRLERALTILATADVVVSPRRSWADLLESWALGRGVKLKVHVLGDVNSARSGGEFWVTLLTIMDRASGGSPWQRLMNWILGLAVRRGVRDDMARALVGVDFSYAEVPS